MVDFHMDDLVAGWRWWWEYKKLECYILFVLVPFVAAVGKLVPVVGKLRTGL